MAEGSTAGPAKESMRSMHAEMLSSSWSPKCDTCGTDSEDIHYFKDFRTKDGKLECGWCRPDYMLLSELEWNILGAPVPPNFLQTRCTRNRYSPYPLPPYPLPLPPLKVPRKGETPVFENGGLSRRKSLVSFCKVQPIPAGASMDNDWPAASTTTNNPPAGARAAPMKAKRPTTKAAAATTAPTTIPAAATAKTKSTPKASSTPAAAPAIKRTDFRGQGNAHFTAGRFEQAIECYTKALEAGEGDRHLLLGNRAQARLRVKGGAMTEEALADARAAMLAAPEHGRGWAKGRYRLALALAECGRMDEAKEEARELERMAGPSDPEVTALLERLGEQPKKPSSWLDNLRGMF